MIKMMMMSEERGKRLAYLLDCSVYWLPYLQDIINDHTTGLAAEDNGAIKHIVGGIRREIEQKDGTPILTEEK